MKYVVVLCDGMSDLLCDELGGKTPMSVAKKPNMDKLALVSEVGLAATVPLELPPGSDVANLSVLGYDPRKYYTGRSPFEAASIGIKMQPNDVAVRVNLVTLSEADCFENAVMQSYCANDIQTEEADGIIKLVNKEYGNDVFSFYTGVSYRHCLIWKDCPVSHLSPWTLVPPHDIIGKKIADYVKPNDGNSEMLTMMKKSYDLLKGKQANCLWCWGEGKKADLPPFKSEFGINGAMISAVDLLKGIGKIAEMDVIEVDGATGYIDTNFAGKAQAAIDTLKSGNDFVYVHIEAPDECGHRGEAANKVKSIELIDELVLGKILNAFDGGELGERIKILISPDHPTPLTLMTHTHDPVPYMIYDSGDAKAGVKCFDEKSAESTGIYLKDGFGLMKKLIEE